jgi:glycosyltransferase involved in cell wall biosynthesis
VSPTPRVSIVLPFRDTAATFADALRSVAAQTLAAFECLLVDDGALDGSGRLARTTAARDRRFRVLRRSPGGLVRALNAGIAAARAPLIARMDADDLAHPQRLERQVQALTADPSVSVMSCLVACFPDATAGDGMRRYVQWLNGVRTPEEIRAAAFVESPIAHPSAVIRRSALDAVGGYRDEGGPEDYDLWLRLLVRGHRVAKLPDVLLCWRDSPGRLSRVDPRYHRHRFFATKLAHFPAAVAPGSAVQIWGAGPTGRRWARALGARGYSLRRFVDVDPRRWGRLLHGVPVEAPHAPQRSDGFVLAATGSPGARAAIEQCLQRSGLRPWSNYLAVA